MRGWGWAGGEGGEGSGMEGETVEREAEGGRRHCSEDGLGTDGGGGALLMMYAMMYVVMYRMIYMQS